VLPAGEVLNLPAPPSSHSPPPFEPLPEPLELKPWERDFMKELHTLIPSPRAAKRFVNTYRLVHASLPPDRRAVLVGDDQQGGYRPALLLLSMLIGYPTETAQLLETLIEQQPPVPWWSFVDTFLPQREQGGLAAEGWKELLERLDGLRRSGVIAETRPCGDFMPWAHLVCRYSFHSRSVLLARSSPAPVRPPEVRELAANALPLPK
jgi:hypothetical protein